MINLIQRLASLTTIPEKNFIKLNEKSELIIANAANNALHNGETNLEVDIGIGTIYIKIEDNQILYKYVPSASLEKYMKKAIVDDKDFLTEVVEKSLSNRILNAYKDLV